MRHQRLVGMGLLVFIVGLGVWPMIDGVASSLLQQPVIIDLGPLPAGVTSVAVAMVPAPARSAGQDSFHGTTCGCVLIDNVATDDGLAAVRPRVTPDFSSGTFASELRLEQTRTPTAIVQGRVSPLFDGWPERAAAADGVLSIEPPYTERVTAARLILPDGEVVDLQIERRDETATILLPPSAIPPDCLLAVVFDNQDIAQWSGPLLIKG